MQDIFCRETKKRGLLGVLTGQVGDSTGGHSTTGYSSTTVGSVEGKPQPFLFHYVSPRVLFAQVTFKHQGSSSGALRQRRRNAVPTVHPLNLATATQSQPSPSEESKITCWTMGCGGVVWLFGAPPQNPNNIFWHCALQKPSWEVSKNTFAGSWGIEVWVFGAPPENHTAFQYPPESLHPSRTADVCGGHWTNG